MRKIAPLAAAATLALLNVATAAAGPLPGFVLAAQTPRFSFYSRGEKVEAAKVEQSVARLEKTLGQRMVGRAEYYRYGTAQELAAGTGHFAAGVTFAGKSQVHSTEACHDHELVHLLASQIGNPGTFFQEGLAVALGNDGKWQGENVDKVAKRLRQPLAQVIARFDTLDTTVSYAVAGSFMGFLVRAHGAPQVANFFRASGAQGGARDAAFQQTFGMSLDQAAAAWQAAL